MMTASDGLKQTWSTVIAESSRVKGFFHRRIPIAAEWPIHAGVLCPEQFRALILEVETSALKGFIFKDTTKGYAIDLIPEFGRVERTAICITATSNAFSEIFTIFCTDILDDWRRHSELRHALEALTVRLARWKRFFQRDGSGLNREDYIGLYGELSLIEQALERHLSSALIISCWTAPLGSNQDFVNGPIALEVKTVTGNEIDKVRITNVRQLDSTGLDKLYLLRYAFDLRQGSGRSLPILIDSIRTTLSQQSTDAFVAFNDRLLEAGFVDTIHNDLDEYGFSLRRLDFFDVCPGFPRILESSLCAGVSEVAYTINLSAADSLKAAEAEFWNSGFATHA